MPVVYVNSFIGTHGGPYFQWNSEADNENLIAFAAQDGVTATVDESNTSQAVLVWESSDDAENSGEVALANGAVLSIVKGPPTTARTREYQVNLENLPPGAWLADQYGRPFALADLLASS